MPVFYDNVNRRNGLVSVAAEDTVAVDGAVLSEAYAIVLRRGWKDLDLVFHSFHTLEVLDHGFGIGPERGIHYLAQQLNRSAVDPKFQVVEYRIEREQHQLLAHLPLQEGGR